MDKYTMLADDLEHFAMAITPMVWEAKQVPRKLDWRLHYGEGADTHWLADIYADEAGDGTDAESDAMFLALVRNNADLIVEALRNFGGLEK